MPRTTSLPHLLRSSNPNPLHLLRWRRPPPPPAAPDEATFYAGCRPPSALGAASATRSGHHDHWCGHKSWIHPPHTLGGGGGGEAVLSCSPAPDPASSTPVPLYRAAEARVVLSLSGREAPSSNSPACHREEAARGGSDEPTHLLISLAADPTSSITMRQRADPLPPPLTASCACGGTTVSPSRPPRVCDLARAVATGLGSGSSSDARFRQFGCLVRRGLPHQRGTARLATTATWPFSVARAA
ncbi:uncharacterized protein LOC125541590 [Triticum urartu]|uniref:uncharacterized protein LOC125541590 n=1 Tax=Triticum urartu TaxID=4572 RepID=UPI002043B418|nr:uncharacterized protein LOC125541590 [Triticum urartu]